jgi:LacI family transcriptional regulator
MKTTIRDIAEKSGVSTATVSRILNGIGGYTDETKNRVLSVIEKTGYTPNAIARGLVSSSTRTIGVLLPCVTDSFATRLLQGIEGRAQKNGYSVIICNTESNGKRTLEYLSVLAEKRIDGLIFASEWLKDEYGNAFRKMGVPVVLVATSSIKFPFPYVRVDDRTAAYQATTYLIEKGHRNIGLIAGNPEDPVAGLPRIEGFRQALREHGLPAESRQIAVGDFHFSSGIAASELLSMRYPEMTAVFAASDEMALGALSWAYKNGVRIPDKLSVVGYDDAKTAEMAIPPLTTVHQPIYEMGEKAADMLLSGNRQSENIIMPVRIVERDSVREWKGFAE